MITRCLLQFGLLLLFSTEVSCLDCSKPHVLQTKLNSRSSEYLEKMSRTFPSQCRNARTAFKPIQDIVQLPLSQHENVKVTILELLQEIFSIFSKDLTQTSWDKSLIARFQNGLYQQIQRLEACMGALVEKELPNPENVDFQLTNWTVKKYFQEMDAFLKKNQYSLCAWEIIRLEILRCFPVLDILTERLENKHMMLQVTML